MVQGFNHNQKSVKQISIRRIASGMAVLLCIGLFTMASNQAYSHPHKSNSDLKREGLEEVKNKHEAMREKAEEQRLKLQERRSELRKEALERREAHKQKNNKRRAQTEEKKAEHLSFKNQLLSMLAADGIISTEKEGVNIRYFEGDLIANGINLSEQFGDEYKALWADYNRVVSDQSYINITAGSYEIREITEDGASHHFVMQTN